MMNGNLLPPAIATRSRRLIPIAMVAGGVVLGAGTVAMLTRAKPGSAAESPAPISVQVPKPSPSDPSVVIAPAATVSPRSADNVQTAGGDSPPHASYQHSPEMQRMQDQLNEEKRLRAERDARIHWTRVVAGVDPPSPEEREELNRMAALERLMERIMVSRRSRDAKTEATLVKSLLPDDDDLEMLLSERAPKDTNRRAMDYLDGIRSGVESYTAERGWYKIDEALSEVTVRRADPAEVEAARSIWLKPGVRVYTVHWHEPNKAGGTHLPLFVWDGSRWIDANFVGLVVDKLK